MNPLLQYLKELNKFLAWFKAIHPGLFEKYKHNIDMPLTRGGRVNINNSFDITTASRQLLLCIVEDYYCAETSPRPKPLISFQ
jgi:hypothetical protein